MTEYCVIKLVHYFIIVLTLLAIMLLFTGFGNHNYPIIRPKAKAEPMDNTRWPWLYTRKSPPFRFADIYGPDVKDPTIPATKLTRRTCEFFSRMSEPNIVLSEPEFRSEELSDENYLRATDPLLDKLYTRYGMSVGQKVFPLSSHKGLKPMSAFPSPYDLHKTIFAIQPGIASYGDCVPFDGRDFRMMELQVKENVDAATTSIDWIRKWDEFKYSEDNSESKEDYIVQPSAYILLLDYRNCPGDERCSAGWAILIALIACGIVVIVAIISAASIYKGLRTDGNGGCWRRLRTYHGINWDAFRVASAIFFSLIGGSFAFIFGIRFYVVAWTFTGVLMAVVVLLWVLDIYTVHHMLLWTDSLEDTGLRMFTVQRSKSKEDKQNTGLESDPNVPESPQKYTTDDSGTVGEQNGKGGVEPTQGETEPDNLKAAGENEAVSGPIVLHNADEQPQEAGNEEDIDDMDIKPINVEKIAPK